MLKLKCWHGHNYDRRMLTPLVKKPTLRRWFWPWSTLKGCAYQDLTCPFTSTIFFERELQWIWSMHNAFVRVAFIQINQQLPHANSVLRAAISWRSIQSPDDQYNRLTINKTNGAQFSCICSKIWLFKNCSVILLLVLKTAWRIKPKRQYDYHHPIPVFYFSIWKQRLYTEVQIMTLHFRGKLGELNVGSEYELPISKFVRVCHLDKHCITPW